ncbi:MAG: hypothetical protein RL616_2684 [Verrucomicrobiota bacterium]|jgi:CheY-like chemotaxis protein
MNATATAPLKGKVLVIDDNPIIQRAVYFCLRDHGVKVLMSGDVTESLHMIRQEQPDVIVLDINFPPDVMFGNQRDGFWAIDWMHRVQGIKDTPIIMISSDDPEKVRARALAAGAVEFLQKPLNKAQLVALVLELIVKKSALQPA